MDRLQRSVLYLARFTFEARSGLSIGAGGADGVYDQPLVRDANGLPMIPGSSLAGVLRHLWIDDHGEEQANEVFGYQKTQQGAASRIEVYSCVLQDQHGEAVEGLLLGQAQQRLHNDRLLASAFKTHINPTFRDRVRMTHRGVATHTGKFDRSYLAAGYRFSGEIRLWSDHKDDQAWQKLLSLLVDPRLRVGGNTRAGLGALKLVDLHQRCFDLQDQTDITAFQALQPKLQHTAGLQATAPETLVRPTPNLHSIAITLTARDFWRIGQGVEAVDKKTQGKMANMLPKLETIVTWQTNGARLRPRIAILPASSIKGALAHRSAYHWHLLKQCFVEDFEPEALAQWDTSTHCEAIRALFGYAKDHDETDPKAKTDAAAGCIVIDDIYLDVDALALKSKVLTHNSTDRFTGGVRERMLFTEELLYQTEVTLHITLLPRFATLEAEIRTAFQRALQDLCDGKLAIGAGDTKGHGYFRAHPGTNWQPLLAQHGETA